MCTGRRCARGCFIATVIIFALLGLFLLIAGVVLVSIGATSVRRLRGLSATEDFQELGPNCTILQHEYDAVEWSEQRSCGQHCTRTVKICTDEYTYIFDHNGNGTYTSRLDSYKRCEDCTCSDGRPALGPDPNFEVGSTVACWRPNDIVELNTGAYQCANDDCYKVYDPADELDASLKNAWGVTIAGIVLSPVGIALLVVPCIMVAVVRCCLREPNLQKIPSSD